MAKKSSPAAGAKLAASQKSKSPAETATRKPAAATPAKKKSAAAKAASGYVVVTQPRVQIHPASGKSAAGMHCATFEEARDVALDQLLECIEAAESQLAAMKRSASYQEYIERGGHA